jgi:hypothetical protein
VPTLPLDDPEPFLATLGVMLYPDVNDDEPAKARAFAAQWLATPLSRYHAAGHRLPYKSLAWIAEGSGETLHDLDDRFWGGTATGELVKTLLALANGDARLASWNNAVALARQAPRQRQAFCRRHSPISPNITSVSLSGAGPDVWATLFPGLHTAA